MGSIDMAGEKRADEGWREGRREGEGRNPEARKRGGAGGGGGSNRNRTQSSHGAPLAAFAARKVDRDGQTEVKERKVVCWIP